MRWILRLAVPLILVGCAYHLALRGKGGASGEKATQPTSHPVQLVAGAQPDRPYKKIAVVHASGSMEEQDAIAALKAKARTLGGDALLNVRRRDSGSTPDLAAASPPGAPWDADVIVWTDSQAGGAAPPPPSAPPPPPRP